MNTFLNWLTGRSKSSKADKKVAPLRQAIRRKPHAPAVTVKDSKPLEFDGKIDGKIIDAGPGKNVLIRNQYVREDTGTHETLKIVGDNLLDNDDEVGIDPYNTGRFDRSKSWESLHNRK